MLSLVKELCLLNGVSSGEDEVRAFIREKAAPYAEAMRTDALGNLIVFKKGAKATGNKLMLTAHMDEVGFIVNDITEDGYLKFAPVGGIDPRVVIGKRVSVGLGRVQGAIGLKAYHLVSAEEEKNVPKFEDMYIDIGARDRADAEAAVSLGALVAFESDAVEFGYGMFKAKAIDDRVGCAVMLKLLEEELPMDCTFVFSTQEEVGTRGAFDSHRQVAVPGRGPVLSFMDGGTVYDRELFELMRELGEKHQIPWQLKSGISGGNDASAVQRTKEGVRVAAMSVAVRYLHAPSSVACVQDFDHMHALARKWIEAVACL